MLRLDSNTEAMVILEAAMAKPILTNSKGDDMISKPAIHTHSKLRAPITPDQLLLNNRMEGGSSRSSKGGTIIDITKGNKQASPAGVVTPVRVRARHMVCREAMHVKAAY